MLLKEEVQSRPLEVDPIDRLHQHREEIARQYPTFEARREYYKQFHSVDEVLERVRERIAEKKQMESDR